MPEFTASFIVAKFETFVKLKELYLEWFDRMTALTDHHAGTQWLINYLAYKYFKVGILPKTYQCGAWYDGCTDEDAQAAIINHTK
jgi:hypothetical protein